MLPIYFIGLSIGMLTSWIQSYVNKVIAKACLSAESLGSMLFVCGFLLKIIITMGALLSTAAYSVGFMLSAAGGMLLYIFLYAVIWFVKQHSIEWGE